MPANVEIKARVADPPALLARARALSDTPPEVLHQRDTFFRCPTGRLKLRESGPGRGELIWYLRSDTAASRRSEWLVTPVEDPGSLRAVLDRAWGTTRVVEKTRTLLRVGRTRIHLDEVAGLGHFVELEVVLDDGQAEGEGHAIAADLMRRLGIAAADLLDVAYADMPPVRPPESHFGPPAPREPGRS